MASRKKFSSREECEKFIDTLSYPHIKSWLADFLMEPAPETISKITITEEEFNLHFRIKQESGAGLRGRPRKAMEYKLEKEN